MQRQRSVFTPFLRQKAEVCNQKAEVDEGAGEGAERLPTDFYKDLECFWLPSVPIVSMGYDQKYFCHGRGREFESRRPRHILKDLSPFWHVTSRYEKVQVKNLALKGRLGEVFKDSNRLPYAEPVLLLRWYGPMLCRSKWRMLRRFP